MDHRDPVVLREELVTFDAEAAQARRSQYALVARTESPGRRCGGGRRRLLFFVAMRDRRVLGLEFDAPH